MKKDCVACYVADDGFLFPSICSAMALRRAVSDEFLDIIILVIGGTDDILSPLQECLTAFSIRLQTFAPNFAAIDPGSWNGTHVPIATIGRFFLPDEVIARYHRLIYIDGDTVFRSSPMDLIRFDPGAGRIAAVEDIRSFARRDLVGAAGKLTRRYFANIGIQPDQGYFNGGLFAVRTEDWPAMAKDSLDFLVENTAICLFHDQSAMNAVLGRDQRVRLSLKWNFQTPYQLLREFKRIDPAILHFTEAAKPWLGPLQPWAEWHAFYGKIASLLPPVPRRPVWNEERVAAANRHYAERVFRQSVLFAHRLPGRWRQIRRYEARCAI